MGGSQKNKKQKKREVEKKEEKSKFQIVEEGEAKWAFSPVHLNADREEETGKQEEMQELLGELPLLSTVAEVREEFNLEEEFNIKEKPQEDFLRLFQEEYKKAIVEKIKELDIEPNQLDQEFKSLILEFSSPTKEQRVNEEEKEEEETSFIDIGSLSSNQEEELAQLEGVYPGLFVSSEGKPLEVLEGEETEEKDVFRFSLEELEKELQYWEDTYPALYEENARRKAASPPTDELPPPPPEGEVVTVKPDSFSVTEEIRERYKDYFSQEEYEGEEYDASYYYDKFGDKLEPDAVRERAEDLIRRDKIDEAIEIYKRLGPIYEYRKEFDKAIEAYKTVIEFNPDDVETLFALGELYERLENLKDAQSAYRSILRWDFYNQKALKKLGEVSEKLGEINSAILAFRKITELDPQNIDIRIKLGELIEKDKEANEAAKYYAEAAQLLQRENKFELALKFYKKALTLNSQLEEAQKGLRELEGVRLVELTKLESKVEDEVAIGEGEKGFVSSEDSDTKIVEEKPPITISPEEEEFKEASIEEPITPVTVEEEELPTAISPEEEEFKEASIEEPITDTSSLEAETALTFKAPLSAEVKEIAILLEQNKKQQAINLSRALLREDMKYLEELLSLYQGSLSLYPKSKELILYTGILYIKKNEFTPALRLLKQLVLPESIANSNLFL